MAILNVNLTDTFSQWVGKSNEVIDKVNDVSDDAINAMEARALVHDWALVANTTGETIPDVLIPDTIARGGDVPSWVSDDSVDIPDDKIPNTIARGGSVPSWVSNTNIFIPDDKIPSSIARDSELFSGSYNDLSDKPSIPSSYSDLSGSVPEADIPDLIARDSEVPSSYSDLSGSVPEADIPSTIARTSDLDEIESIENQRSGQPNVKIWVGTEAQYNAITTKATDVLYHRLR